MTERGRKRRRVGSLFGKSAQAGVTALEAKTLSSASKPEDGLRRLALVDAEECLKSAFYTDVRPAIREWAASKGLPADPMDAFRQSGYQERIDAERGERNMASVSSYA